MMKNLYLTTIICSVVYISCEQKGTGYSVSGLSLDSLISRELASGIRKDTIFLGFKFGMTEKQALNHVISLEREGVLYKERSAYKYKFSLANSTLYPDNIATFDGEFFESRLYKLTVSVKPNRDYGTNGAALLTYECQDLYEEKYGYQDYSEPFGDDTEFFWIKGNRMIRIFPGIEDCRIVYLDTSVDKLVLEREKHWKDSLASLTKHAI